MVYISITTQNNNLGASSKFESFKIHHIHWKKYLPMEKCPKTSEILQLLSVAVYLSILNSRARGKDLGLD